MNEDEMMMMDDTMSGGSNDDTMSGGSNDDTMSGGSNDDTMSGGSDDDTMSGGSNDDTMSGGSDDDTMTDTESEVVIGISTGQFFQPPEITASSVISITDENGGTDNRFEWGVGASNSFSSLLQFDGGDFFGAKPGEPFKIGQLLYRNGTIDLDSGFDGEFAFSLELDIDGVENDPDPFVYLFDILNTPNNTGDPVEDADVLRFASSGLTPQTFELNGETFTLELLGFSQDGGQTFTNGFDSPEEGFDIANLYGQLVQVSDDSGSNAGGSGGAVSSTFFDPLATNEVEAIEDSDGIFVGGSNGPVAGSALIDDASTLGILWSGNASANSSFNSDSSFRITVTTVTIELEGLGISVAIGSEEDDRIIGSDNNDAINGAEGDDSIEGSDGNDVLMGSSGADTMMGGEGTDCIYGNEGDDVLSGGAGDDLVRGGKGNDFVNGDAGNDILSGDSGFDILTGGSGEDVFILQTEFDATEAIFSTDFITDFTFGDDTIALASNVIVSFEVADFNADGQDDVGIKLDNGSFIGFVLGTNNVTEVEQSIVVVPEGDFAII